MDNILPLFKSHYSLGKSILTLEEPFDKKGKPIESSIFHLLKTNNLDRLTLVDDNVSGLLEASENAFKNKITLNFGLRIWITNDVSVKEDGYKKFQSKYIIFLKNLKGYYDLIKIWSFASKEGFYYEPRIDFKVLKTMWNNDNLKLVIPFYDSFLHCNNLEGSIHIPDYKPFTSATFLIEDNNLPFDDYLTRKVKDFTKIEGGQVVKSQSIFYKSPDDFVAYMAFRCLNKRTTMEKPELTHMGSDEFNFNKWIVNREKI